MPNMEEFIKLMRIRADHAYRLRNSSLRDYGEDDPYYIALNAEWLERESTLALLTDDEYFQNIWKIYIKGDAQNE